METKVFVVLRGSSLNPSQALKKKYKLVFCEDQLQML